MPLDSFFWKRLLVGPLSAGFEKNPPYVYPLLNRDALVPVVGGYPKSVGGFAPPPYRNGLCLVSSGFDCTFSAGLFAPPNRELLPPNGLELPPFPPNMGLFTLFPKILFPPPNGGLL